jgi:hypothetical protein
MYKRYSFFLLVLFTAYHPLQTRAAISDSLHVLHYDIHIDTLNFTAHTIQGSCNVLFEAKQNNPALLQLNLLHMIIDSVIVNNAVTPYIYNDTLLLFPAPANFIQGDTVTASVFYHGAPVQDASGWGGFYFSSTHAFNMGVGFASDPHNYGKAWFPCIDEFTDRSLYDFYITTSAGKKAFCNGILTDSISNPGNTVTWHWKMNQTIPSYLACIAVADYYTLQRTSNNVNFEWACLASDTAAVLNTFQHLDTIFGSFITAYGPYPFDRAGYSLVPFNSGAMEHATSIHIGTPFISGLTYETLWAHELSHMWWGDKVTCANESEMWLNEGFASYNEAFMTEKVYGTAAYRNWLRINHKKVLQFAHIDDGNYFSLINVPHNYTYGSTVYKKGADVIHTLRNYMGDSAFFAGCRYYMSNRAYGNADSQQLRDDLTAASGIDMSRFFSDWVFTEGFPHFSIDSVIYMPGGLDHYFVYIRQRSKGNSHIYSMPVEINFTNGIVDTNITVTVDSATQMFHIPIYFYADMISLDRHEKISDAITDYEKWISSTGTVVFNETNTTLNTLTVGTDSSLIRIENNWVKPDDWKQSNPGIRISDYHYWRVDGIIRAGYSAQLSFSYNGSNSTVNGHIDNTLITGKEDSLVLLYRTGTADDWHIVAGATLITGASALDKVGAFRIDSIAKGEYTFGYRDYTVAGTSEMAPSDQYAFTAMPNPSSDTFNIQYHIYKTDKAVIRIVSAEGKLISERKLNPDERTFKWMSGKYKEGIYIVELIVNSRPVKSIKLLHVK